jgi:hypothetical protein
VKVSIFHVSVPDNAVDVGSSENEVIKIDSFMKCLGSSTHHVQITPSLIVSHHLISMDIVFQSNVHCSTAYGLSHTDG